MAAELKFDCASAQRFADRPGTHTCAPARSRGGTRWRATRAVRRLEVASGAGKQPARLPEPPSWFPWSNNCRRTRRCRPTSSSSTGSCSSGWPRAAQGPHTPAALRKSARVPVRRRHHWCRCRDSHPDCPGEVPAKLTTPPAGPGMVVESRSRDSRQDCPGGAPAKLPTASPR